MPGISQSEATLLEGKRMQDKETSPASSPEKYLTVRQAAFIGVGAMVGAGIFALLGAAGEIVGGASFAIGQVATGVVVLNVPQVELSCLRFALYTSWSGMRAF